MTAQEALNGTETMASAKCPECGERVKMGGDGKRLRCPECGEKFAPPEEPEGGEESRPRPRAKREPAAPAAGGDFAFTGDSKRKRKPAPSRSSRTKTIALVAGLLLVAVGGVVAIVLIARNGRTGGPGGPDGIDGGLAGGLGLGDSSKVTRENFNFVKPGMSLEEIEAILGGSHKSSESEVAAALQDPWDDALERDKNAPANPSSQVTCRRWESGGLRLWVTFAPTRDGPRAMSARAIQRKPDRGCEIDYRFGVEKGEPLARAVADRKREAAARLDAKWVRGGKARTLLGGEWANENADRYSFAPPGTRPARGKRPEPGEPPEIIDLAYHVLDDQNVELTDVTPRAKGNYEEKPPTDRYEYYVNQDELTLINVAPNYHRANHEGTFYRLPLRAGGPGDKKLLAPLLADLVGPDGIKQVGAMEKLKQLGKGAAIALPALTKLRDSKNGLAADFATEIIDAMK